MPVKVALTSLAAIASATAAFTGSAEASRLGAPITVSATSYSPCSSGGITASGRHTRFGYVASNWHPLGTLLRMRRLVLGHRYFRVEDRIGYGTQLDIWQASCPGAIQFGRRRLSYQVVTRPR